MEKPTPPIHAFCAFMITKKNIVMSLYTKGKRGKPGTIEVIRSRKYVNVAEAFAYAEQMNRAIGITEEQAFKLTMQVDKSIKKAKANAAGK